MAEDRELLWPDLSHYGIYVGPIKLPSGEDKLVMIDESRRFANIAANMGFLGTRWPGVYIRDAIQVNAAQLRGAFPRVRQVRRTDSEIRRDITARTARAAGGDTLPASAALRQAVFLGYNHLGQEVYEGETGRFVKAQEGEAVLRERDDTPAIFLRARDDEALALCADAFVRQISEGQILRTDDVQRFLRAIGGKQDPDEALSLRANRAIDAALIRALKASAALPDGEAFGHALKLYEGQPTRLQSEGTFMTPLPIAVGMQRLLGAHIDGADKHVVKIMEALPGELSALVDPIIERADRGYRQILGWIFGLPLEKPELYRGTRFLRSDYLDVLRALGERDANGRAVFLITAELAGKVEPGFRRFLDHLMRHYRVDELVDLDTNLVGGGNRLPSRMMVVGPRLESPSLEVQIPTRIDVLRDYSAFWERVDSLAVRLDGAAAIDPKSAEIENTFQAPYIPTSQVSEPEQMVPRNLVGPTRHALAALEADVGKPIDEYVCEKLGWTVEELTEKQYLASEQVDAVALAIWQQERGRGMVITDQTGIGKGRCLAAIARYHRLCGEPVVFMTKTADLFNDFYRDIEFIGSLDLFRRPLVVNAGAKVELPNGEIVARSEKRGLLDQIVRSQEMPADYDIVLMTYSQVNRPPWSGNPMASKETIAAAKVRVDANTAIWDEEQLAKSKAPTAGELRARWLERAIPGCALLLDESHEGAGPESNTGILLCTAVAMAESVIYSSATFAKTAANMQVYSRVFPRSMDLRNLSDVLEKGGEPLQEALCAELAKDGALIRREHDLSTIDFDTVVDDQYSARNREIADKMAEIYAGLCYISGEVEKIVGSMRKAVQDAIKTARKNAIGTKGPGVESVRYTYQGFGSRLYGLNRQLMMALKADFVADLAIKALQEGRKPVIAFENTMEAVLRKVQRDYSPEAIEGESELLDSLVEEDAVEETDEPAQPGAEDEEAVDLTASTLVPRHVDRDTEIPGGLSFRDVVLAMTDNIFHVTKATGKGEGKWGAAKSYDIANPALKNAYDAIAKLIKDLPDIPASPLDRIVSRIEEAGFTVGELSGRQLCVKRKAGNDGKVVDVITPRRTLDKTALKSAFNNGAIDGILLSRSGGTGISLHSSRTFLDQRRRDMLELQSAADVAARVQMFGRVARRDQVSPPIIRQVSSNLPAENRLIMLQNMQLRKMSANITSNRESAALSDAVPDILNRVGNEVVLRFLENNPLIAQTLNIEMLPLEIANEKYGYTYYVDKLTGRIAALSVSEQERAYEEIAHEYRMLIAELDARGANTVKPREYDLRARTVSHEVIYSFPSEGLPTVFNDPVMERVIEWDEYVIPVQSKHIFEGVQQFRENAATHEILSKLKPGDPTLTPFMEIVAERRPKLLADALTDKYASVEAALVANNGNLVSTVDKRLEFLTNTLAKMHVGAWMTFSANGIFHKGAGLIVDVKLPATGKEHLLGQYTLKIACPGQEKYMEMTLNECYNDPIFSLQGQPMDEKLVRDFFDRHKEAMVTYQRSVMDGNLYRAVQMGIEMKAGTIAVYTDADGVRRRGVVVPHGVILQQAMRPSVASDLAYQMLASGETASVMNSPSQFWGDCVMVKALPKGGFQVLGPGSDMERMKKDPKIAVFLQNFYGGREVGTADVNDGQLEGLLKQMELPPYHFKFYSDPGTYAKVVTRNRAIEKDLERMRKDEEREERRRARQAQLDLSGPEEKRPRGRRGVAA